MFNSMGLPPILIGILWPCRMPLWWGCVKKRWTPLPIAICLMNFQHVSQFARCRTCIFNDHGQTRPHTILEEGQVSPLPQDCQLPLKILQVPLLEWIPDIQHLHLSTSADARNCHYRGEGKMFCRWELFAQWWVEQQSGRLCSEEKGSDIEGGWNKSTGSRNRDRLRRIGKRLCHSKNDGSLIDAESYLLDAIKCFGTFHLSVSKVEVLEGSMEAKY